MHCGSQQITLDLFPNHKMKGWTWLPILIDWLWLPREGLGPCQWDGKLHLISNVCHGAGLAVCHRHEGFTVPGLAYLRSFFDSLRLNQDQLHYLWSPVQNENWALAGSGLVSLFPGAGCPKPVDRSSLQPRMGPGPCFLLAEGHSFCAYGCQSPQHSSPRLLRLPHPPSTVVPSAICPWPPPSVPTRVQSSFTQLAPHPRALGLGWLLPLPSDP